MLTLRQPVPVLSLNLLGFGVDVAYSKDGKRHTLTVCANFAFGCWSRVFEFGGADG